MVVVMVAGLGWVGTGAAVAASKDAVGLSKISLPSGPGSIEGLGDAFEPQLNSGTATYAVPVEAPPGVLGLQPDFALRYNGGSGNGPYGLGWSDGVMSIRRQTEKGLPTYGPRDGFTFQGEELVALADGTYRVENESGFWRVRRWEEGWEITDKTGRRHYLGTDLLARVHRPEGTGFGDTYEWRLNTVIDTRGNRMEYHYLTHPDSPGARYLSEIRYSLSRTDPGVSHALRFQYEPRVDGFSSFLGGFEIRWARRCREIRVETRGALVRRYELAYALEPGDPVETLAPGDTGLEMSLLRRVTPYGNGTAGESSHLPPLRFGYTRWAAVDARLEEVRQGPAYSLGDPSMAWVDLNGDSLPDLLRTDPRTSEHEVRYNLGRGVFGPAVPLISTPTGVTLDNPGTQLADYDGDGLADLVQKSGAGINRFVSYANLLSERDPDDARPGWGRERSFEGRLPPFDLEDPSVRTLDLDGDKRIDFFRTTPWGFIYYYNRGTWWEEDGLHLFGEPALGDLGPADDVGFSRPALGGLEESNPAVHLADMNGDRLLDLVRLTRSGGGLEVVYWPNRGHGRWAHRRVMQAVDEVGPVEVEDVQVVDVNGDGLADLGVVGLHSITWWVNQGNQRYSAPFTRIDTPRYVRGETVLRQVDINGNGSTDFVWENWEPRTGGYRVDYLDLAPVTPNLLRIIDNGIGLRTTIDYRSTTDHYLEARAAGHPWRTRLPFPSAVVSRITREIGLDLDGVPGGDRRITEYTYRDGYYDRFEKEFRGFAFARQVELGEDHPEFGVEDGGVPSPTRVTRMAFHTGAPDGVDNNGDGRVDERDAFSGAEGEPLKGRLWWTEVTLFTAESGGPYPAQVDGEPADDAVVFTREIQDWRVRLLHGPEHGFVYRDAWGEEVPEASVPHATTDGKRVAQAYVASVTREIHEANGALAGVDPRTPVRPPRRVFTETEVDPFGNVLMTREYGEHGGGSEADDERFTRTAYALRLDAWLLALPARVQVTDEHGAFVSETRNYYDGDPYVGLPLGQVGLRGELTREERFVNGPVPVPAFNVITGAVGDPRRPVGASITVARHRYDSFGNLVETRDALYAGSGAGHARRFAYDPEFHTYVVTETLEVGNGEPDLVATAEYDAGGGVLTAAREFNGNLTTFHYDAFWRLVAVVRPGDSVERPTTTHEYRPADPFRGLVYRYDLLGRLSLEPTGVPDLANGVATRQREVSGADDVFITWRYTDGTGASLGTLHENDVPGQWVAKDFRRTSVQGAERQAFLPFLVESPDYAIPAATRDHVASYHDAAGRVVRRVNPPETTQAGARRTETRSVYLPLETQQFDEEDSAADSPHQATPMVQHQDGLGRLVAVEEVVRLDDVGRPVTDLRRWRTRYGYDLQDRLVHLTDSQGNERWYRHDGLGRKIYLNDPNRGVLEYTHDDASNLVATRDAKGQRITYTFDGLNRLLTEDYHDAAGRTPDVRYVYDRPRPNLPAGDGSVVTARNLRGQLAWVEDVSGEEHTSYDARGRVAWVVKRLRDPDHGQWVGFRTAFDYDALDRLSSVTYPDNDRVDYEYNARNLLRRILGGPAGGLVSGIQYQPSDQLARIDYGNGVRTSYQYDPRLRLTRLHTVGPRPTAGSDLIHYEYQFDGASNLRVIRDQRPTSVAAVGDPRRNTQFFQYDDLYRLTRVQYSFAGPGQADRDDGWITYRFDRLGNMLEQRSSLDHRDRGRPVADLGAMDSGGTAGRWNRRGRGAADPPGPHALTALRHSSEPVRALDYDANGNLTRHDGMVHEWDFKDRLVAVENDEMRAEYAYDYGDRRVMKRVHWKTASDRNRSGANPGIVWYPDRFFEVREHEAPVKYVWNGETRVARVTGRLGNGPLTQRLRLQPGRNLVGLAVTATNALHQLAAGGGLEVLRTARWHPTSLTWVPVLPEDTLTAGTVLWLQASVGGTVTVTGVPGVARELNLPVGGSFVGGWGLQPLDLPSALPPGADLWLPGGEGGGWRVLPALDRTWAMVGSRPRALGPHQAMFLRMQEASMMVVGNLDNELKYYHQDHLRSIDVITDARGEQVWSQAYYPFGTCREINSARSCSHEFQFTQKESDSESKYYYFESRFLISDNGRFNRCDPALVDPKYLQEIQPQMLHSYAYAMSRPLVYNDPTGNVPTAVIGAVLGAATYITTEIIVAKMNDRKIELKVNSLLAAAAMGAITSGASAFAANSINAAKPALQVAAQVGISSAGSAASSVTEQLLEKGSVDMSKVGMDAVWGGVGYLAGSQLGRITTDYSAFKVSQRTAKDLAARGIDPLGKQGSAMLARNTELFKETSQKMGSIVESLTGSSIEIVKAMADHFEGKTKVDP